MYARTKPRVSSIVNATSNLEEEQTFVIQPELKGYKNTFQSSTYRFFIDEDVREPAYYRNLISTLMDCNKGDIVEILVNTNGGRLDSAESICNAIRGCEGHVIGVISGAAYSAGSAIILSCHDAVVYPSSTMMVHQVSWGAGGSNTDIKTQADFFVKKNIEFLKNTYEGFLTPSEIDDLTNRQRTFWMDSKEIQKRFSARLKYFKNKSKE